MKIRYYIEEYFGLLFIIAAMIALILPLVGEFLLSYLTPMLIIVLYLTFLKIDFTEILASIKKPLLLIYILIIFLFIIPVITFYIGKNFDKKLALGFLFLAGFPCAVSSPALTDVMKGETSLTFSLVLGTHFIAPISIPFLFSLFTPTTIKINTLGLCVNLALFIIIPIILALLSKKLMKGIIEKTKSYYTSINVLLLTLMVYTIISSQSKNILANFQSILLQLLAMYIFFICLFFSGYFMIFWREKKEKIAVAVGKTFMNNSLAIVLAFKFLPKELSGLIALSALTWATTPGIFKFCLKYLK